MSAYTPPVTHTVVIRNTKTGRIYATYATPYPDDAQRYITAVTKDKPHLAPEITPVDRPEIPEGLRPFEEQEAA